MIPVVSDKELGTASYTESSDILDMIHVICHANTPYAHKQATRVIK